MEDKDKSKSKAGSFIGWGFLCLVLLVGFAMYWPSRIVYRPKSFCSRAENDANNIMAAISDYFADPKHLDITRDDIEQELGIDNPWTLTRCGDNFYIHVVDRTGKCPAEIQDKDPNWNAGTYTRSFF